MKYHRTSGTVRTDAPVPARPIVSAPPRRPTATREKDAVALAISGLDYNPEDIELETQPEAEA